MSKFMFPLLLFQVFLSPPPLVQSSPPFDLCVAKEDPDFNLTMLAVNKFSDHLMMTMRDKDENGQTRFTVYTIPYGNFENSYGQMLISVKGVPLEKYWKHFEPTNPKWGPIMDKIIIFWLANKLTPFMYFLSGGSNISCPVYNVTAQQWYEGQTLYWSVDRDAVLSFVTDEWQRVYMTGTARFPDGKTKRSDWLIWHFSYQPNGLFTGSSDGNRLDYNSVMFYVRNRDDSSFLNVSLIRGHDISIDSSNDPYRKVDKGQYYLEPIMDWTTDEHFQAPGFIHKGWIYLFDRKNVFIFEDGFDPKFRDYQPYQIMFSSSLKVVKVRDYFHCDAANASWGDPDDDDPNNHNGGKRLKTWVIIAIVVAILLLLLMCCLLAWLIFGYKKKKKDKKKKGSSSGTKLKGGHSVSKRAGVSASKGKLSKKASTKGKVGGASRVSKKNSRKLGGKGGKGTSSRRRLVSGRGRGGGRQSTAFTARSRRTSRRRL